MKGENNSMDLSNTLKHLNSVRVFTGSDRIGPDRARNWPFSSFFIINFMFVMYIYDHNNDVWIIRLGFNIGHIDH